MNIKNITIIIALLIATIYALPNLYGEDPVIIISNQEKIKQDDLKQIKNILESNNIINKSLDLKDDNTIIIRFKTYDEQLKFFETYKNNKQENINISLNIMQTKNYILFEKIYAKPMKLGLDLRGGVQLTIKVNYNNIINNNIKAYLDNIKDTFKQNDIKLTNYQIIKNKYIEIKLNKDKNIKEILKIIENKYNDLYVEYNNNKNIILISIKKEKKLEIKNNILEKTIFTLSKRVNELGISDSIVQKKGKNKIIVEIPGIQDIERAKNILGKTASLEFMLIDTKNNIKQAINGNIPDSSKIYKDKNNYPILVKNKSILTGDSIIYASSGFENQSNKPCINIKLGGNNIKKFEKITSKNIGKPMAIIYKEIKLIKKETNGIVKQKEKTIEKIISIATIMNALSTSFQITGLNIQESNDLALLLRSGSLPATISIIEEKIIGPTLGYNNIKNGLTSVSISFIIILLFMLIYYKKLGFIANITLIINLIFLIGLMSIIGVTLTLPGIAGIVLTIGMAIDANILIFERIKEEKILNSTLENAIKNGFKNATTSILDANITTLIVGIVLFTLGHGAIKGFAITLSLGIITSIYCAIIITKSIMEILIKRNIKLI